MSFLLAIFHLVAIAQATGSSIGMSRAEEKSTTCSLVRCDFQKGTLCNYVNSREIGPQVTKLWIVRQIRFHSVDFKKKFCKVIAASYLDPEDSAVMQSVVFADQPFKVKFLYYAATDGIQLMACCNNATPDSCNFKSNLQVTDKDKAWKEGSLECPANTNKVLFIGVNIGSEQGTVALDKIECF